MVTCERPTPARTNVTRLSRNAPACRFKLRMNRKSGTRLASCYNTVTTISRSYNIIWRPEFGYNAGYDFKSVLTAKFKLRHTCTSAAIIVYSSCAIKYIPSPQHQPQLIWGPRAQTTSVDAKTLDAAWACRGCHMHVTCTWCFWTVQVTARALPYRSHWHLLSFSLCLFCVHSVSPWSWTALPASTLNHSLSLIPQQYPVLLALLIISLVLVPPVLQTNKHSNILRITIQPH